MAVMNVTSGNKAVLSLGNTAPLAVPGAANSMVVPNMQDVTINATPGTVRYSTLDLASSRAFTTVNENSISLNVLVDETVFFGGGDALNQVAVDGLLKTSIDKTEIQFSVAFEGSDDVGDYYVSGKGFIGGLAPTASIDSAVWITPMEIIVNGELTIAQTS